MKINGQPTSRLFLINYYKSYINLFIFNFFIFFIFSHTILSPIQKVACLRTKYYKFQQRLRYKCITTKTNFSLIDESYTSKICSNCCNYNEKLKG